MIRYVRKFCRSCLSYVTRRGPSHLCQPPLMLIPVKGSFHRVAVDVLRLPLTPSGNKYVVLFMDYLTKWVEALPAPDQQATTIATLPVEHIICCHGGTLIRQVYQLSLRHNSGAVFPSWNNEN